jgi:hypothetical protein
MTLISYTKPATGETADASDITGPLDTIYNDHNGNIDGNNISASAALSVASVTTSGNAGVGGALSVTGITTLTGGLSNWDGWITPDETWTYASPSTFTVTGDQTAKYIAGLRIKWTQTTVKYGIITGSTYSAPNTTVTIAVDPTYVITDAPITDNYYSTGTVNATGVATKVWSPNDTSRTTTSATNAEVDTSLRTTITLTSGKLVQVIWKCSGIAQSDANYGVYFDIGLDGTSVTSTSGYSIEGGSACWGVPTANWQTTMCFYFTNVGSGSKTFYPLWKNSTTGKTTTMSRYAGQSIIITEIR